MTTNLIIILASVTVVFLTWMFVKAFYGSKEEKTIDVEVFPDEPVVVDPIEKVEEKTANAEESLEDMEKRLVKIANPDSEKPFAKISTPEISEIPASFTPTAEKTPKKRNYKKRTPKN
jgi:hypothetical protein